MTLYFSQIHLKVSNYVFFRAVNQIKGKIVHLCKFLLTSFPPHRARLKIFGLARKAVRNQRRHFIIANDLAQVYYMISGL
jgi:hypothetical protein